MNKGLNIIGKMFLYLGMVLCVLYVTGALIFATYYNWQYAKNNNVVKWMLFSDFVATAKAFGWPYYIFFERTIESKIFGIDKQFEQDKKISDKRLKKWLEKLNELHKQDLIEYPNLITTINNTNYPLSTAYKSGPKGKDVTKLSVSKNHNDGLILKMELPQESFFSIDIKTSKKVLSPKRILITMRDRDIDGMLDEFKIEPPQGFVEKKKLTRDGFVKFNTEDADEQYILISWYMGIRLSIIRFVYMIDIDANKTKIEESYRDLQNCLK